MSTSINESTLESDALEWPKSLGWVIKHGPDIAPEGLFAERADYREVVLAQRLHDALLPKLIRGAIPVKDAERFLKERGL